MKASRPSGAFTAEDLRRVETAGEPLPVPPGDTSPGEDRPPENQAEKDAHYSPVVLAGLVRLGEVGLLVLTGFAVHALYVVPKVGYALPYFIAIPAIAVLAVLACQLLRTYTLSSFRRPVPCGFRVAAGWSGVVLAALAAVFFLKLDGTFSRVWMLGWYAAGLGALLAERSLVSMIVERMIQAGQLDRRTVVVGGGPAAEALLKTLSAQKDTDLRIYGFFDDRTGERSTDEIAGFPKLGNVDDLVAMARHTRIDLIIFAMPITAEQRLLQMLRKLWVLPIDIRLAAHMNKLKFRPRSYSYIGSVPVLDVFDKPIADWDVVIKSIFDRIVGALALVVLSPVMAAVALAVKLDSRGPVFFKQKRYGFNNEVIEVRKFRSMYVDVLDHAAAKQVTRDDPRVTRVGRFIRRTSLDELPQLFNVVFEGSLSLVGPRPHAVHAKAANHLYDEVVDGYFARHRVRPGITGWAQINGWRGETDTPEKIQRRVEHDLTYIENWSIFFDIYILLMTPFALIRAENAY